MHAPQAGRLITMLTRMRQSISVSWRRLRRRPIHTEDSDADPMLAMLMSLPFDDEPTTDDDRQRIDEGWEAYRNGQVVSAEDVRHGCRDTRDETAKRRAAAV
jgi:hypothetical protein